MHQTFEFKSEAYLLALLLKNVTFGDMSKITMFTVYSFTGLIGARQVKETLTIGHQNEIIMVFKST